MKNAKAEVMKLVAQATATTTEEAVQEAPAAETAQVPAKGRKSKKNDK